MSRQQRLVFAAIAAVLAVVAVVVLSGGSDEPGTVATTTTTTPEATATAEATAEATEEPTPEPTPEPPAIEVERGAVKGGETEIEVRQGETVRLSVISDVADEVHVHGYDVTKDLEPGRPARLSFKATIPGIFEVELERSHLQVARLTVRQ